MQERLQYELNAVQYVSEQLYKNNVEEVEEELGRILQSVSELYLTLLSESAEYKKKGIEIPDEILLNQLKNLAEAYERHDILRVADTLKYEIYEGLSYYEEVLLKI